MRILVVVAMITGLSTAQAAEAPVMLACQGTTSFGREEENPQPISMGLIVNFTTRTVLGFVYPGSFFYPVKITDMDDVTIAFEGSRKDPWSIKRITGNINRVTGELFALHIESDTKPRDILNEPWDAGVKSSTNYNLKCSPTQRKF